MEEVKDMQKTEEIEEWRDVAGYEGVYQVSSLGRIRGLNRKAYVHKNQNGYVQAVLRIPGQPDKMRYVHRLVAMAFLPNPDNLPEVHHIDADKHNNRVDNLMWISLQDNRKKAFNGMHSYPKAPLTGPEKAMLVELHKYIRNGRRLSRVSGISENRIYKALREAKESRDEEDS